ncbi:MAG: serine hydrolase [Clostridia bacterium]|nr:serine hydrolase [Clostridia bacterium]
MNRKPIIYAFLLLIVLSIFTLSAAADANAVPGDLNGDGTTDAADARLALRASVGFSNGVSDAALKMADVNHDTKLGADDARLILRASVDLEDLNRFHTFTETVVPPKEFEQGYTVYTCKVCGYTTKVAVTAATHVHVYTAAVTSPATCAKEGVKTYTCKCGASYTEKIAKTGDHSYTQQTVKNSEGRNEIHHICTICKKDADGFAGTLSAAQQKTVNAILKKYEAVGAEVAVIKDGKVSAVHSYGDAVKSPQRAVNSDTKYRVASLSKLVTFSVFMALQDRGIVDENEDISTYFGYKCYNPYHPECKLTASMFMCHSTGIVSNGPTQLSKGDLCKKEMYYDVIPGNAYVYSNVGAGVVACICELATGRYLDDLAKEYIFRPLGMDATYLASTIADKTGIGVLYGEDGGLNVTQQTSVRQKPLGTGLGIAAGSLTVSAKDYARLIQMFLNDGKNTAGETVLSKRAVNAMLARRVTIGKFGMGYATQIETTVVGSKKVYIHTGSAWGMFSAYVFSKEDNCAVVVLTSGCKRQLDEDSDIYNVCLEVINAVYPKK